MRHPSARRQSPARRGFTLIEIMITVAIVGILAAVALPQYSQYVMRGKVTEGFNGLTGYSLALGQFYQDNRSYATAPACTTATTSPPPLGTLPAPTPNFTYDCVSNTINAYVIRATGTGPMAGFKFTLDQNGGRATTGVPANSGWPLNGACWIASKSGTCY